MSTTAHDLLTSAGTLPGARGPITGWLFGRLRGRPEGPPVPHGHDDPLVGDDTHLALHCLYELEYRGFADVPAVAARDPLVVALRHRLEDRFLRALEVDALDSGFDRWADRARASGPGVAVDEMLACFDGPSLSQFVLERGDLTHFQEFMIHRSAYQLKEADPHTMGMARLAPGRRKSAFVEIQFDEYGAGEPGKAHAELFAAALRAADLDPRYGHHLGALPGPTLATGNLLGLLAGRRDLLGPLIGHLALFEMTSVGPMARYAAAAQRFGLPPEVDAFYQVHVEADRHHGHLARTVLLGDDRDDALGAVDLTWGAFALLRAEDRFARSLLESWSVPRTSLRSPLLPPLRVVRGRSSPVDRAPSGPLGVVGARVRRPVLTRSTAPRLVR